MSDPKVSFVVPSRNRVEWVGECIQGLLSQSEKDIEVIIVDDASNDGSEDIFKWFRDGDPRVVYIRNEEQRGAGVSRNNGIALAKAPIIGVCDDDDVYPIERAEMILKFFEINPKNVMLNTPYVRIGYCGEILEDFKGAEFDEEQFKKDGTINFFCHPSAAYTKKDILEIGGYKAETKEVTDDYQLVKDWIAAGKKIGFMPGEYLNMHRVLPESIMSGHRGFNSKWAIA